jgi:VWFA-related protein
MKRVSSTAFAALLAAVALTAQGQDPGQTQPTFRSRVSLVRVDVSVTGRDDETLDDLQPSDFEVDEDGSRQVVESAQFVRLDGTRTGGSDDSLEIRSQDHAAAEAARDDVRIFAIFLDDYHIERNPEITNRAKRTLRDFLKQLGPNDLVTVMDPITPLSALEFTRALDVVQARIDKLEGRRNWFFPARNAAEADQAGRANAPEIRGGVSISALGALVAHLGGLREGRKSVLFVSQGPPTVPGSQNERAMRELLQAANRGNVTIHVYDPQPMGFIGNLGRSVLQRIQSETGGRAFFNANGTAERMSQIVTDASAYYLIGYSPSRELADGKFHRIDVRVRRDGARVLARNGYWAPTAAEMNPAPPAPVEPGLTTALTTLAVPTGGRPVDVWIGSARGPDARTRLTVSWDPLESTDTTRAARVTVEPVDTTTQKPTGDIRALASSAATASDPPTTTTFDVTPGESFVLRFAALDADGEVIDRWTQPVEVPPFGGNDSALMSTPRVFRAQSAFEARALASGAARAPSASRRFRTTDRVFVEVDCYVAPGQTPSVVVDLLNGKGELLTALPPPAVTNGRARVSLPISSLAPSTYVLRLTARAGDRESQERIAFQVVR